MASVVFSSIQEGTPWLSGYNYRRMVVIAPQVIQIDADRITPLGANLTDFPVPIYFNADCGKNNIDATSIFSLLGDNSLKIAVTGSDGVTEKKVEVAAWDSTEQIMELFVKHTIDYTDYNVLWVYYDPDVANNTANVGTVGSANAQAVWSTAIFRAVYHLGEDPSGGANSIKDSTSNGLHGTPANMVAGNRVVHDTRTWGLTFDGVDEIVDMGDDDLFSFDNAGNDDPFSIDCFATIVDMTQAKMVVKRGNTPGGNILEYLFQTDVSDRILFNIYDDADNARIGKFSTSAATPFENTVQAYSGTYDGTNLNSGIELARQGLAVAETNNSSGTYNGMQNTAGTFKIGGDLDSEDWLEGTMSEVRLALVEHTPHWVRATALSLLDKLSYIGEEEQPTSATWGQRIEITIAAADIDGTLTDFPMPVKLGDAVGKGSDDVSAIFDEIGANFYKLAFTDDNGNQCRAVVIDWDEVAETALLHVKMPSISSSADTTFYIYYDALRPNNYEFIGVPKSAPAVMVWDLNYEMVLGFNENPAGSDLLDYSAHNRNGTPAGSMDINDLIAGYWGSAWAFDGTDDIIGWGDILDLDGDDEVTVECIAYPGSSGTNKYFWGKQESSGDFQGWLFWLRSGASYRLAFVIDGGANRYFATGASTGLNANAWKQLAATFDGTNANGMKIIVDGVDDTDTPVENTDPGATTNISESLNLNGRDDTAQDVERFEMARISSAERSVAWLNATWEGYGDNLLTYGAEQTSWADGLINVLVAAFGPINAAFSEVIDVDVDVQTVYFAGLPIVDAPVARINIRAKVWNLGAIGLLASPTDIAGNKPKVTSVTGNKPEVT